MCTCEPCMPVSMCTCVMCSSDYLSACVSLSAGSPEVGHALVNKKLSRGRNAPTALESESLRPPEPVPAEGTGRSKKTRKWGAPVYGSGSGGPKGAPSPRAPTRESSSFRRRAEPPVGLETISLQLGRGEAPPHLLPGFLSRGLCSCGSLRTGRPSSPLCPVRPSSFRRCELLPHQTAPLSPAGARGGRPFQQDEGCARVISAGPRDAGGDPPLSLGRGIPAPRTGLGSATAPLRTPRPPGLEQPDSGAFSCPSRVTEPFLDSGLVLTGCGLVSRAPLGSLRSPHLPVSISRLPPITAQASQCRHQQPITASADRSGSGVGTPLLPLIPRGCPPPRAPAGPG